MGRLRSYRRLVSKVAVTVPATTPSPRAGGTPLSRLIRPAMASETAPGASTTTTGTDGKGGFASIKMPAQPRQTGEPAVRSKLAPRLQAFSVHAQSAKGGGGGEGSKGGGDAMSAAATEKEKTGGLAALLKESAEVTAGLEAAVAAATTMLKAGKGEEKEAEKEYEDTQMYDCEFCDRATFLSYGECEVHEKICASNPATGDGTTMRTHATSSAASTLDDEVNGTPASWSYLTSNSPGDRGESPGIGILIVNRIMAPDTGLDDAAARELLVSVLQRSSPCTSSAVFREMYDFIKQCTLLGDEELAFHLNNALSLQQAENLAASFVLQWRQRARRCASLSVPVIAMPSLCTALESIGSSQERSWIHRDHAVAVRVSELLEERVDKDNGTGNGGDHGVDDGDNKIRSSAPDTLHPAAVADLAERHKYAHSFPPGCAFVLCLHGSPSDETSNHVLALFLRSSRADEKWLSTAVDMVKELLTVEELGMEREMAQYVLPVLEAQARGERRWCDWCYRVASKDLDLCGVCNKVRNRVRVEV